MTLTPHESMVLEASAGTGKTYSIERLVLKALLEEAPGLNRPLSLQEILLVTFTKAAVQELKDRIRALLLVESRAEERNEKERRLLKLALSDFDAAPIYTIHGFCYKVLKEQAFESGVDLHRQITDDDFKDQDIKAVVDQVFREEITKERFTQQQFASLLHKHGFKTAGLVDHLASHLKDGVNGVVVPDPEACYQTYSSEIRKFRGVDLESIKKIYNKSKYWNAEALERLASGVCSRTDFEKHAHALLQQVQLFAEEHLNKKLKAKLPPYIAEMLSALLPPLKAYADERYIYLRLLKICQERLNQEAAIQGPLTFNASIHLLIDLVQKNPRALKRLKDNYRLVFIDEFQDTDPDQWNLFQTIFKDKDHRMILVGDPKQAIYGFRGADIYTYREAVEALGEDSKRRLTTNYRSDPLLVKALNGFFQIPSRWISLPFHQDHLPYIPVEAGVAPLANHHPSPLTILMAEGDSAEERQLIPYFAKESIRLKEQENIPWERIAILVRGHQQAKNFQEGFSRCGIPTFVQRDGDQLESSVLQELMDIMEAVERPQESGKVKKALCGRIFGWSPEQIASAETNSLYLEALAFFRHVHEKSYEEGFPVVLFEVLNNRRRELLGQEQGEVIFEKAVHFLEKLIEAEAHLPDECLNRLTQMEKTVTPKSAGPGVQIITLFISKGLEYDAVFVPGIYERSLSARSLEVIKTDQGRLLTPLDKEDPLYDTHLEEQDAEKARQFYVALTRAKHRLYIPIIAGMKAPTKGKASALELFMAQCEAPEASWQGLYEMMGSSEYPRFFEALRAIPEIQMEVIHEESLPRYHDSHDQASLIKPTLASRMFPEIFHYSFSSLSRTHESIQESTPVQPDGLPAGKETGILLHALLEKAPWRLVRSARSGADFLPYVKKHLSKGVYEEHQETIAEMLFNAFAAPLAPFHFALRDVDEGSIIREMEFSMAAEVGRDIPELQSANGVVKGVVDLFFRHQGRYYLVDWKSNLLANYGLESLKEEMTNRHYFLQEQIYRAAILRYLTLVDKDSFGGSFYLFLRGLKRGEGVFYHG